MRLTQAQRLMWLGQRIDQDAPLYNMALAFRIQGGLDDDRFIDAFASAVMHFDGMRVRITTDDDGEPRQHVHPHAAREIERLDFSRHDDPYRAFTEWADKAARRTFRLDDCLWHSALVRLGDGDHVWYLNQHHLATDAWSCAVLFDWVSRAYARAGSSSTFSPPEHTPFVEYVAAEAKSASSERAARALTHWRDTLGDRAPAAFYGAPADRRTAASDRLPAALTRASTARLDALAQPEQCGAFNPEIGRLAVLMALLAGWMHRVSGEPEFTIGVLAHNRSTAALRQSVGMFIETLPITVRVSADESLTTLVRRAVAAIQGAFRWMLPGVSQALARRPVQAILNYLPLDFSTFAGHSVGTDWLHAGAHDPAHQLRLQAHDFAQEGRLTLQLDLNHGAFADDVRPLPPLQLERLADRWLAGPDVALADIDLLDDDERATRLDAFNQTEREWPQADLAALLSQRSGTHAGDVVRDGEARYDRDALDAMVSTLSAQLRADGVGAGWLMPIYMYPSVEALVAVLATLHAGAAFLPLDPDHPSARTSAILAELADVAQPAGRILTNADAATRTLAISPDARVVDLDALALAPETATAIPRSSDDLAYVLYTSGSSGRPKGTLVHDGGLLNYLSWARGAYLDGGAAHMPLFTSLAFDLTLTSLLLPMISGGTVHVYSDPAGAGLRALRDILRDNRVDTIKLTPSHLSLLCAGADAGLLSDATRLKRLILGGEILTRTLALKVDRLTNGRVALYNEYGPTETVVGCMTHRFDPASDDRPGVPVGKPIANTRVYLLDAQNAPVATGVVGELCVAGAGVGRGYLNRAELTEQRFVPAAFGNGRMYRTGDTARWLPDGRLDFLGRNDRQVKLHGHRIELDEIGAVLTENTQVTAAVATVHAMRESRQEQFCARCGLSSSYPGAEFDDAGVCNACREFDGYRDEVEAYFGDLDELNDIFARMRTRRRGDHDCIMLLSGGKDSTYVLYQLVGMGLDVLALTLDNGFISDTAKQNIRRVTDELGVEHVFATTPHMNAIFADSLSRHSNVCNGCFKTIYTLSMNLARERGIPCIVTGLARGQLFETRLVDMCFDGQFDPRRIDATVKAARKAYHRIDDAPNRLLPVKIFEDERVFDEIEFVDFYRYCDVELADMLEFLDKHAPWIRPEDTGRSTNCLINDAGIYVHKRERGFHNYALPYSWDVRLGHKTRTAAMDELDDRIHEANVQEILDRIGYRVQERGAEVALVVHYSAAEAIDTPTLRAFLTDRLPQSMIPTHYVHVATMPMTTNGKIDVDALPPPTAASALDQTPPADGNEATLHDVWCRYFGFDAIGVHSDFFELGGDSVLAIQIVDAAYGEGLQVEPRQLFEHPTIAELAALAVPAQQAQEAPEPFAQISMDDDQMARLKRQLGGGSDAD